MWTDRRDTSRGDDDLDYPDRCCYDLTIVRIYRPFVRWCVSLSMGVAVALGGVSGVPLAHADVESDAKDLFARARELRSRNDCAGALPLFYRAHKLYPSGLGSLRNIAECEEASGHYASARRAWLDLKRALITMPRDAKYEGWDRDAEASARRLVPMIATVVVDVIVASSEGEGPANEKSGVELFVNGEGLGTALVGAPLERDPGTYRIRAQASDASPVEQQITLAAGETKRVSLRLMRSARAATTPGLGEPVSLGPVMVDTGRGKRTAGWILVSVGALALAGGGVALAVRGAAKSDVDEQCPARAGCSRDLEATVRRGELMTTLTNVLLPVGALGVAAGITFVIWGNHSHEPAPAAMGLPPRRVTLGAGPGNIVATWRF